MSATEIAVVVLAVATILAAAAVAVVIHLASRNDDAHTGRKPRGRG